MMPVKALATTYKKRLPLASVDCMEDLLEKKSRLWGLLVPQCSILFLASCLFISSVSQSQKQSMSLLPLSALEVTPWEGLSCWRVLQAPPPIRRAGSTVPVLDRAYCCPGPLPKHLDVSTSPNILLFSLLHLRQCPVRDCACECSCQTVSTGIFSLLQNTQKSNYFNQPIVSAIPELVHHGVKYTLNPDPNSGSDCQLT